MPIDMPAPERSVTKILYVVTVEDPSKTEPIRFFAVVGSRLRQNPGISVEITGSEVTEAQVKKLQPNNINADAFNKKLVNIIFPWRRLISIQNITYNSK